MGIGDDNTTKPSPPLPEPPSLPERPPPSPLPATLLTLLALKSCDSDGHAMARGQVAGGMEVSAATVDGLTEAVDQMQVDGPTQLVVDLAQSPSSLPPLPSADECLERAARLYDQALHSPAAEWVAARVDRLDTMYNAACACARRGGRDEGCARLLGALAAEGALRRADVEGDADLAPFVHTAWMQSLLSGLPS